MQINTKQYRVVVLSIENEKNIKAKTLHLHDKELPFFQCEIYQDSFIYSNKHPIVPIYVYVCRLTCGIK